MSYYYYMILTFENFELSSIIDASDILAYKFASKYGVIRNRIDRMIPYE